MTPSSPQADKDGRMLDSLTFWRYFDAMKEAAKKVAGHWHPGSYSACVYCQCMWSWQEAANDYLKAHEG